MGSSVSRRRGWVAVVIVLAVVLTPSAAIADQRNEERTDMVRRGVALAMELDELAASDAELTAAIELLDYWMAVQAAEVERLQTDLEAAEARTVRVREALEAKEAEVADLESLMATMAINAYVDPPHVDTFDAFVSAAAPADAARLVVYLDVQAERDTDLVTRLRQARRQLERLRERADESERRAERARDEAARVHTDLSETRTRYDELRGLVRYRRAMATFESELVALDLWRSNQRLIAEADAVRARGVPLVEVRGLRVHRSIAGQVELMLAAAEADGVRLSGGAHRTFAEQVELRRQHCGEDEYAIWEMPPEQCSPPTARPGNSMHELGLALDLNHGGHTIASPNSPGFRWLAEHAHLYGFSNLPSEPWHWSLDGS